MSFKKLKPEVVEALKTIGVETLDAEAKAFFSVIKSGKNLFIPVPASCDKTTTSIVSIFNKVNQEYEGSPRAIYITDTIGKAEAFHKRILPVCRRLDLTADLVHDKGNMIQQRNDIFDGTEIVIGNPKRVHDLYLQNGINLKMLDLFIVDDLDECLSTNKQAEMKRLIESLEQKTQVILFTNVITKKVDLFIDSLEILLTLHEQNDTI